MKVKIEKEHRKVDNPIIFILVLLAFSISLIAGLIGFLSSKDKASESLSENTSESDRVIQQESITELFEEEFESGKSQYITDEFSVNDPFIGACASTAGDNLPSVVDGTVCLR